MEFITGKFLIVRAIVVSLAVMTAGCIIIPTGTSVSGSIESPKLESLVGSKKAQVLTKIGKPTYLLVSPRMRESYYLYEYDVTTHHIGGALIPNPVTFLWPIGGRGTRKAGKLCYVLAFDADQSMVRYEIKDARQSDKPVETQADESWLDEPSAVCQEYFWSSKELSEMIDIDLTKHNEDVAPLRMLAMEGDPAAAIALTWGTGDITSLKALALNGETHAASSLYDELSRDSQTIVEAWRYLCVAANRGDGKAQEKMGFWYRTTVKRYPNISELQQIAEETDIYPDNRIAYMWYTLSDSNGNSDALRIREYTVRDMTPEEIGQAEQMVRDWKPGDCPSAEHRLGLPGFQSQAEQDDAKAAIESERQTTSDAWKWLCMIANSGHGEAQRSVGNWHRTLIWQSGTERLGWLRDEVGIQPDNRVAYMWYTLADANGNLSALSQREVFLEAGMTPEKIGQAEQMIRDWKPGDCPNAEHRLGPPGLQSRAEQDYTKAAIEIAALMGIYALLESQAEGGNTNAAFALYLELSSKRQSTSAAWKWLCMIANSGHGEAQRSVGNWHRTLTWQSGAERLGWLRDEVGIQPDNRVAYMWYTLADANGNLSTLSQREGSLKADMTPEEIGQAEQMVRDWKPGDCPSAEHRLGHLEKRID